MRSWAIISTLLYAFIIGLLLSPYFIVYGGRKISWWDPEFAFYFTCGLLLCQAVLLLIPVRTGLRRFIPKRSIKLFIFYSGFFVILLVAACVVNLLLMYNEELGMKSLAMVPIVLTVIWLFWGLVIIFYYRVKDQDNAFRHTMDAVFKASIAETLIAIPTHIITRQREDCCAPYVSMVGIITGCVIFLFAFGPGALILYRIRFKKKLRT